MRLSRFIRTFVFVLATALAAFSQNTVVNGAINPDAISDSFAYASAFRMFSSSLTPTSTHDKVALVGFSNTADANAFEVSMNNFQSESITSEDSISLAQQTKSQLATSLTTAGLKELQTYVNNRKSRMSVITPQCWVRRVRWHIVRHLRGELRRTHFGLVPVWRCSLRQSAPRFNLPMPSHRR